MSRDDKVAVVIGASRGIGEATARALASGGCTVVLAARGEDRLHEVAEDLRSEGAEVLAVATDAGEPADVQALIDATLHAYGRLDIAVNNAAVEQQPTPLAELPLEQFDAITRVNLRGLFVAMAAEIKAMTATDGGAIVNVASTAGLQAAAGIAGYVATKHAMIGLTKVAALDYATSNIRVNAVAPGPIATTRIGQLPDDIQGRIAQAVPMRRLGRAEEVAEAICWLTSDQASFVTGATLSADGGRLAGWG